ncbi:DUF4445 domain-containing protein, partial [bacterium]|nr:DUF4445 domain-containing protein [bacterium]
MGKIYFPQFKRGKEGIDIHPGLTILDYAQKLGIKVNAECGGIGKCGKCIVRIEKGKKNLNSQTLLEKNFELKEGERLACQARIIKDEEDVVVYVKNFGEYTILKYGMEREIPISPVFYHKEGKIYKNGEEIGRYEGKIYGLAIDVGTTTVVFDLIDLETGNVLATIAKTNPQISFGNDVISRIEYTFVDKKNHKYLSDKEREKRTKQLQKVIIDLINQSIKELSEKSGEDISKYIYEAVVVGNSTMRNLFFGVDVSTLGKIPFEPLHKEAIIVKPDEIGLEINKKGQVYGAPLIGGHVGADILADILASEIYNSEKVSMIVDIGTNGEVVIGNKERIVSTSAAAGGAFEGASVSSGIGGIKGAISKIEIIDGRVVYSTIGNAFPIGICGSGLIDLLAELLTHGIMDEKAKIKEDFYITAEIKITQQDIYQLITSKAAIKTAEEILMKYYPVEPDALEKIFLSGGFGNFINVKNAMKIGLIPEVDEGKVIK